jgi:hypothetical protein
MGEAEIREYLLHVKREEKVGPATLKGNVAALKFLYTHTLKRPEEVASIPQGEVSYPRRGVIHLLFIGADGQDVYVSLGR